MSQELAWQAPAPQRADGRSDGVVLAWALAGLAASGAGALAAADWVADSRLLLGPLFAGALGGAGLGRLIFEVERHYALRRPALRDARGGWCRPLHSALFAAPLLIWGLAAAWLALWGALAGQPWPSLLVGGGAWIVVLWGLGRLWAKQQLTEALEASELGDAAASLARLVRVATSPFGSPGHRSSARFNLALLALREGNLAEARHWFQQVAGARAGRQAKGALVWLDALEGQPVHQRAGGGDPDLAGWHEPAVLYSTWRYQGLEAARQLAPRLRDQGPLTRALQAAIESGATSPGSPLDPELSASLASLGFEDQVRQLLAPPAEARSPLA